MGVTATAIRLRVHQSVFSRGWRISSIVINGSAAFFKRQERADSRASFFTLSVQAFFFSAPRVEECSTLDKTLRSSRSFSSQPTNPSGGGAGLPTILHLNNNGEVNIACLRVFIFFTRSNCRTTIILCKIMLGETFHSRHVCHVSNHSNHSISTEKKTAGHEAQTSPSCSIPMK